jgi:hypothetical protein
MSQVLIKIGTNSSTVTTMPNSPTESIKVTDNFIIDNQITYHGGRIVNVIGNSKKIISLTFREVKDVDYLTFLAFAKSIRKWWVIITGRAGVDILNTYCHIEIIDQSINRVGDDTIPYDFELKIYEL